VTINTAGVFADGIQVRDHYTRRVATVGGGKVTLPAGQRGIMLLEQVVPDDVSLGLAVPNGVSYNYGSTSGAKVSWNAVEGATSYNVYVNSDWIGQTKPQTATTFTFNTSMWRKGLPQQIEVSAVHEAGESLMSAITAGSIPRDVISIVGNQISINGKALPASVQPKSIKGRLYLPFKSIFAPFGVTATWDGTNRMVVAKKANFSLAMTLNAKSAKVNGQTVALDAPAQSIGGTTYVPLRFVGTSLDATIQYRAK
jgi:hypothetical protein